MHTTLSFLEEGLCKIKKATYKKKWKKRFWSLFTYSLGSRDLFLKV